MLKNKKICVCTLVIIALVFGLIGLYKYLDNSEKSEIVSISKLEQDAIDSFYKDDYGNISKGEIFDIKYVYFDPINVNNNIFEIVKKKQVKVKIDQITLLDENGNLLCDVDYQQGSQYDLSLGYPELFLGMQNDFKLYGNTNFSMLAFTARFSARLENDKVKKYQNLNTIILILNINGKEEKHYLTCDSNKQFEIAKKYKDDLIVGTNRSIYAYEQTNYYFGYLLQNNFNQWYKEIKLFLLSDIEKDNIDGYHILRFFDNANNKGELKHLLELNNNQFKKYQEVYNLAKDKGLISHIPKYLQ